MIRNLWEQIELRCGCHESHPIMTIQTKGVTPFYACPKYYPENRDYGEKACVNHIGINDFDKMLKIIEKELRDGEDNFEQVNLTNLKFKIGAMDFQVEQQVEDKIKINVVNKNALK